MKIISPSYKLQCSLFILTWGLIFSTATAQSEDFVIITNTLENKTAIQASLPINVNTKEVSYVDELLTTLLETIKEFPSVDNIHLFTQGDETSLHLGNGIFDRWGLDEHSDLMARLSNEVGSGHQPNLFIYGCHIATTTEGKEFLRDLASAIGFNILGQTNCNSKNEGESDFGFSTADHLITTTDFSH